MFEMFIFSKIRLKQYLDNLIPKYVGDTWFAKKKTTFYSSF